MPLKLEIKRTLTARSDRVKCVDLHPSEPWMLSALFNGNVHIWNIETQQLIKTFEVCDLPVRAGKFVSRKNWVVTGSDDMLLKVFNYNTLERVHSFEAHSDYLRSIVVHPTQSFLLTSSDDMTIKLWDWDKNWSCVQVFEGHSHYVMQLAINPKDHNSFASASLDKTVKVWSLGQPHANFTLEGHEAGINCVDYYCGGDKPYIISGADDRLVKIWDYQTKTCVQTLESHSRNVSAVAFHPELPIILSASEDGTVRVWHANTYRLENTLNYNLERVWAIACMRGSNIVALGYDEGAILLKLGREDPAISMDLSGKVVYAKHAEFMQTSVKQIFSSSEQTSANEGTDNLTLPKDGERLPVGVKSVGTCDIYPQSLQHNLNGRFIVACGDGEYIVYTSMALRNKCFGQALEFVWSQTDATTFAIRENSSTIKIHKNFKEAQTLKPALGADQIFGGFLLAVRGSLTALSFYDWDKCDLVRRIELSSVPKSVHWNELGQLVAIVSEDSTFILQYKADVVRNSPPSASQQEDGIEEAFDLLENGEISESIKTATWVGDCLLFTNAANRLQYFVGGEMVIVAHLDKQMYILGYLPKDNRAFLCDRDVNMVSYSLLLSVLEYQTAVMRGDFTSADSILPSIPRDQRVRVAHFLQRRGFPLQALAVTTDQEHKFELCLLLGKLDAAYELASSAASQDDSASSTSSVETKWKQLADAASRVGNFRLAQQCLLHAGDHAALLSLATSAGDAATLSQVAAASHSAGQDNIAFLARFLCQDVAGCLALLVDAGRLPEAMLFARTYAPSQVPRVVELLREKIRSGSALLGGQLQQQGKVSAGLEKMAQSLANPAQYENLFPGWRESIRVENFLKQERGKRGCTPASSYPDHSAPSSRDVHEEMLAAEQRLGRPFPSEANEDIESGQHASRPLSHFDSATHQNNGLSNKPGADASRKGSDSDLEQLDADEIIKHSTAKQVLSAGKQQASKPVASTATIISSTNSNSVRNIDFSDVSATAPSNMSAAGKQSTTLAAPTTTHSSNEEEEEMDDEELDRELANIKLDPSDDALWDAEESD